jgi:uncharacterized damage-inducible protein DinB
MNLRELRDLYRHMEWADASVWQAVLGTEEARSDQKLRELFHHLHLVQWAFLRAGRGEARDAVYPTFDDGQSVMEWGRSYYPEVAAHLEKLSDEEISRTMELPWTDIVEQQIGRTPAPISIAEMMLQVPLHSLYHRGQVNARLRATGGEPPTVDYIIWLWREKPVADWEFAST